MPQQRPHAREGKSPGTRRWRGGRLGGWAASASSTLESRVLDYEGVLERVSASQLSSAPGRGGAIASFFSTADSRRRDVDSPGLLRTCVPTGVVLLRDPTSPRGRRPWKDADALLLSSTSRRRALVTFRHRAAYLCCFAGSVTASPDLPRRHLLTANVHATGSRPGPDTQRLDSRGQLHHLASRFVRTPSTARPPSNQPAVPQARGRLRACRTSLRRRHGPLDPDVGGLSSSTTSWARDATRCVVTLQFEVGDGATRPNMGP